MQSDELQLLLASLVLSSDDAIIAKDLNGLVLSWNKGAERIYGYPPEEVLGKPFSMLVPPENSDEASRIMERIKEGRRIDPYETIGLTKDGRRIHVSISISPIKNENGNTVAASSIARDITEKKELQELQQKLAAIVESSEDAILSKTLEGDIASWNRSAQALYGYTPEEVIGRNITLLIPPERPDEIPEILRKLSRGERIEHYETVLVAKDGRHAADLRND